MEAISAMVQGRIVWCSGNTPFEGKLKTDSHTKQPKFNKAGEQIKEYGFGLAVPKEELAPGKTGHELMQAMQKQAMQLYPSGQVPQGFAWKIKDGDMVDHNGKPFGEREGYKGCIVFALTTTLPIKFFKYEGQNCTIVNEGIKCGDYVQVQVQVKAHPAFEQGRAGLYLNPNAVLFLAYGKEIINTPSGEQIFGAAPPAFNLPPGASVQPTVPQGGMPMMAMQPQAPMMAAPAPTAMPQPHYGVLPQTHQPPQHFVPPPAPAGMPMMPAQQPLAQHYPQPTNTGMPPVPGVPGWPQQ